MDTLITITDAQENARQKNRRQFGKILQGLAAFAAVALVAGSLSACGETEQASKTELTVLSSSKKVDLDPAKSQNLAVTTLGLVTRRLTAWNVPEDGSPTAVVPDLATSTGEASDAGLTWTYRLKDGIKFETGADITAADIKWGIERSFAPELPGGLQFHKSLLKGGDTYTGPFAGKHLESIETPDAKTIVFHLDRAYADWPWIVSTPAFSPVPSGTVETANYGEHPVASGPYKVETNEAGVKLVLTKNEFWDKETDQVRVGTASKIIHVLNQSAEVATDRLIADAGDDQFAFASSFVSAQKLPQIQANPEVAKRLVTSKSGALYALQLNTSRPALSNQKVRQALQYAVDKNSIRLAHGGEIAGDFASTLITPGIEGREEFDLYPASPSGDLDKARDLFAEAGVDPSTLVLELATASTAVKVAEAQAVQQGLKRLGITVNIKQYDEDSLDTTLTKTGNFDLNIYAWQPDYPSQNANIQPLYASDQIGNGNSNLSRFSDPKIDAEIIAAQSEIDEDTADGLWTQIDREILEQSPSVPLFFAKNTWLPGSRVTGFYIGAFPSYPNYLRAGVQ